MLGKKIAALLLSGAMVFSSTFTLAPEEVSAAGAGVTAITERKGNDGQLSEMIVVDHIEGEMFEQSPVTTKKGSAFYTDQWEKYNSYFFYNQLTENEKKLYDLLNAQCLSYLNREEKITGKQEIDSSTYYYMPRISTIGLNLSKEQIDRTVKFFHYENPQYFFLNNGILSTPDYSEVCLCIYPLFAAGSERIKARNEISSLADSWAPTIEAQSTDAGKVKAIHDLVTSHVTYNSALYDSNFKNDDNEYSQSLYSVMGWSEKKSVCAGYSMAMAFLCNKYGIDTVCVTSDFHQWNLVRIGSQWYILDATWDDADGNQGYERFYFYFCRSKSKTDEVDVKYYQENKPAHVNESFFNGYLPECVNDSGSEYESAGTIPVMSTKCSTPVISSDGKTVTITADSGLTVFYTTDGTQPSQASSKSVKYTGPFAMANSASVRAVAIKTNSLDSETAAVSVDASQGGSGTETPAVTPTSEEETGEGTNESEAEVTKPSEPKLKSVKSTSKKKLTVKWAMVSGADGYEISYSISGNTKKVKVKGEDTVSKVIKNLKSKKTCKVKVRAFVKTEEGMLYSPWSAVKKAKIK